LKEIIGLELLPLPPKALPLMQPVQNRPHGQPGSSSHFRS
jgi:hypothetical protein